MPCLHPTSPAHPALFNPRYAIASMYVGLMGKFPSILTTIFDFISVSFGLLSSGGATLLPPSVSPPHPLAPPFPPLSLCPYYPLAPSLPLLPPLLLIPL